MSAARCGSTEVAAHELAPGGPGAPLVVLAHGLEDSWVSWLPLARCMAGWRLVALDLPWRAGSDYRWRRRPAPDWLGRGLDLLDAPAHALVAHSFGAGVALELLCERDPRAGRAAALLCPLYRPPELHLSWRVFDRARRTFNGNILDGLRLRLGARAASLEPGVLEQMLSRTVDRVGPAGFLAVFDQFAASAYLPLEKISTPTMVLAGDADPTLLEGAVPRLAMSISGATARMHPDYDHYCHVRRAKELASQLTGFIAATLEAAAHPQEVPQ